MSDLGGTMNENLRDKIAEVMSAHWVRGYSCSCGADLNDSARHLADAVLEVVGGLELDRLRAEVERWQEKANEAGAAYANANSKHHVELDRANRLERLADTLAGKAVDLEDRAHAAEAERDALRARLAKVEALAWVSQDICTCESVKGRFGAHRDECPVMILRAALASVPEPSDSEPVGNRLDARWLSFPGKNPVCRDCGADWSPVRRGECVACGSDAGPLTSGSEPAPDADREAGER